MKREESWIGEGERRRRCDLLSELTGEDLWALFRERMSVEVDTEKGIEMGSEQAGWCDSYWTAYGFAAKVDYDGINNFSLEQKNVVDDSNLIEIRERVLREKLREKLARRGTSGYAALRWDGGAEVEEIHTKRQWSVR